MTSHLTSNTEPQHRVRIFLDATLMIHHGGETPLGLVRVEQYVAQSLANDPSLEFRFLYYDRRLGSYRPLTFGEHHLLDIVLNHRYDRSSRAAEGAGASLNGQLTKQAPHPSQSVRHVRSRLARFSRMHPDEFGSRVVGYAARRLPESPDQSLPRRAAVKVVRRLALMGARQLQRSVHDALVLGARARHQALPVGPLREDFPDPAEPGPGDVLISIGNLWDYMDYAQLHRLCLQGVRFVAMVHDVIPMELPFASPRPPHVYHRHCVEIGHLSNHLLANSRHSAATYQAFIAEPNDLSVSISHSHPPNFLKEHAATIGEEPMAEVEGRPFVVYCSTIEIRKNHVLLLQLWDHLLREVPPERTPVLVFVGKWGWGIEHVRLHVERNWRLRDYLYVLDQVRDDQLIWLYRNARFTVFPSYAEGYGLGVSESLSFGTPVVTANCPALLEAAEGLMPSYSPYDYNAWHDEILRLINDDAYLQQLRLAAARYRGPAYDAFAVALRNAAIKVSTNDAA
jgi:glycosyltransferase involved in cell wall biosynthesis